MEDFDPNHDHSDNQENPIEADQESINSEQDDDNFSMSFDDFIAQKREEASAPVDEFDQLRVEVEKDQAALRIDKYLVTKIPNLSRSRLKDALKDGDILVNGMPVKPNYKVKAGDVVMVIIPKPFSGSDIKPEDIPINIIFEDKDILLVNKEPGMVVHPGHNNWTGTLVNALAYHFDNLPTTFNGEDKPGLVHRIDKDTSGLLVVAKNDEAMFHLARQFYNHTIERTYYALVWGEPEEDEGTIATQIGRSVKDRRVMTVLEDDSRGKWAVTHYKVLKRMRYVSLVQCNLETGRTHQIRVHMKHLGHPLFADQTYGGDKILKGVKTSKFKAFVDNCIKICPRQALHAKSLGFEHPKSKEWLQFDSELPDDLQALIDKWDKYVQYH